MQKAGNFPQTNGCVKQMEKTDFITFGSLNQEQNGQIFTSEAFYKCFISQEMGNSELFNNKQNKR